MGARRERQGTGEFVARELERAGCTVCALVGTRPETVEAARADLARRHGIEAQGYLDLPSLLAAEAPDVVAICSPPETHLELLELALAAGCHVYCEKPLVFDAAGDDAELIRRAEAAIERARATGRLLGVNTQWPFTLAAFDALYPGGRAAPQTLRMWLTPDSGGARMVVDSASHVLSLAYALVGPGELRGIAWTPHAEGPEGGALSFGYRHAAGELAVRLELRRGATTPRPAGYAIDGQAVEREVELPDYRIRFVRPDGARSDPADPLVAAVGDFVQGIRTHRPTDVEALKLGVGPYFQLVHATHREVSYG
ncbi:MAG: Gfo/Idh/MocA family oxidoreductase [Planctomycetes bacterium]|nr:Gfo/Idh/MocA family oxidoreductase [Planctomycetota bacterium]